MPKTKIAIIAAISAIAVFVGVNAALAVKYGETCNTAVYPYNPSAQENPGEYQPNFITPDSACKQNLLYPPAAEQQYKTQPPNPDTNLVKAGDENKKVSWPVHEHAYFNDKTHDGKYYKSAVDQFIITIQNDGVANLDLPNLNNLTCVTTTPKSYNNNNASDLFDCSGTANDLYGGTTVTKTNVGNKIEIKWEFGLNENTKKPVLFGNNGSSFPVTINGQTQNWDLTDPYNPNRKLEFWVNFPTKNVNQQIWSATTTSKVLIADLAILESHYVDYGTTGCLGDSINTDKSGWCYLDPNQYNSYPKVTISKGGTPRIYYWFPIGSVASIWKKPPVAQTICADLSLQITQNGATVNQADVVADTPMTLKVTPTYLPAGKTVPLKYGWSAGTWTMWFFTANGMFKDNTASDANAGNPYLYDDDTSVYYGGGSKGTTVYVDAYYVSDGTKSTCHKEFPITKQPPPGATCTGITLVPNYVNAPGQTPYTATVTYSDGKSYNTTVNWTGTNGSFTAAANETKQSGIPPTLAQYLNTFNATGATASVTAKVTAIQGATNSAKCQEGYTWHQKPVCSSISLTPNTLTAPGTTPFTATVTYSDGQSHNTEVTWTKDASGSLVPPLVQQHQSSTAFNNTYTTTNISGSVSAKVSNVLDPNVGNSAKCQNGETVTNQPKKPACLSVTLSPNSLNAPGTTPLTATVTYDNGQSYNTELTWSQTNGSLAQSAVQQHQSSQAFANTYNTGNDNGSVSAKVTKILDPNVDNSMDCQKGATINQNSLKPYCTDLILSPNELNSTGSTNLSAKAVFSDGNTYDTTVQWTGSNGSYSSSTTQTHDSGSNFLNTFNIANENIQSSASVSVIDVPDPDADNGPNCSNGRSVYTPPEQNKCEDITVYPSGNELCVDWTGDYNGTFTWSYDNKQVNGICSGAIPSNTAWSVKAKGEPGNTACQDNGQTEKRPPRVSKGVRATSKNSNFVQVISIPSNQKQVDYRITFNADSNSKTTATIVDDISDGSIDGTTRPVDLGNGHIDYVYGSQSVDRSACSKSIKENCYTGDISNGGITLVKVTGTVTINYKGEVKESAITPDVCKEGKICQEKYVNSAKIDYQIFDDEDNVIDTGRLTSNEALVQIFCQYILTRAAGDIYLETDLNAGVDIRMCSKYTSTTGILVVPGTPGTPDIVSTGPSEIMSLSHEICTAGQSGSIPEALKAFYGQTVVQNLSSQICEVKLQPGTAWQQKTITNDIEENKTRISRWEPDYSGMNVTMSSVKLDSQYSDKKVYHVKDGNLTIDQPYTLSDGEGAKTIIVENGDLYINKNISYGTCLAEKQPCTVNDVASLAFIVLNGNVYVDPSVTEMSGVYFVQEGDRMVNRERNGRLYSLNNEPSYYQLVIYGSVYGDIEPLFLNRLFAGDPTLEEAGIVVRFDERIILNTPPGLRDVMNYSSTEVAR